MKQWGFFFNQDRCLGCKTCMTACKNWNEDRRGDNAINVQKEADYIVPEGSLDNSNSYVDPKTGTNNYSEYRKFHMKEEWRRLTTIEEGAVSIELDGTFNITAERRYLSISCNHCKNPICVQVCPVGNIHKEQEKGIVLVSNNCISCGKCKQACPWDAPQYYDENYGKYTQSDVKRPRMTKCNFCIDRIETGMKPACVAACWNRALDAGPIDELDMKYRNKGYDVKRSMQPDFTDLSTEPCILFKEKQIKA